MPFLRMLRKRFHRSSSAYLYPSRRDAEPISVKRMERILRERNIVSKHFHVKYVGCTTIASPTLSPDKQVDLAQKIVRRGPRRNKSRVTLIFTPDEVFVNDTISRCGLANYTMEEVGSVFALTHDRRLVGMTIRDATDSPGQYSYFLFRCSVKDFKCENGEVMEQFQNMYEEHLKIEEQNHEHSSDITQEFEVPTEDQMPSSHGDTDRGQVEQPRVPQQASQDSAVSLTQQPRSVSLAVLPTLNTPSPPTTPSNLRSSWRSRFGPEFIRKVKLACSVLFTTTTTPLFSNSGITLCVSPCSLILTPHDFTATFLNSSHTIITNSTTSAAISAATPITSTADLITTSSTDESSSTATTTTLETDSTPTPLTPSTVDNDSLTNNLPSSPSSTSSSSTLAEEELPSFHSSMTLSSSPFDDDCLTTWSMPRSPSVCSSCSSSESLTDSSGASVCGPSLSLPALGQNPPPPPTVANHSYPTLGRTLAAPSPLLEGILASLFIYPRRSSLHGQMLGSPDSRYKLVPVQSCWSTARLTFIDEDEFFEEDSEREKEPPRRRTVHPDIQKIVDRLEKRNKVKKCIHPMIQNMVDMLEKQVAVTDA